MTTLEAMAGLTEEMVALRRHLHANPEIGLEEYNTSALVAKLLGEWGFEIRTGYGKTGLVGTLRNGTGNRAIGIRADMDALPIVEETNLPYASKTKGVMHACGHDGHTTMLLAAAKHLAATKNFDGIVHLIFQPAEENFGGAQLMIEDGLFRDHPCDAVFGMHNIPEIPAGVFAFKHGTLFANCDGFDVTLIGLGGHASTPEVTRDPIVAGASTIMALQTLVSRNIDPMEAGVLTIGVFEAGKASNAIPQTAHFTVDVRSFTADIAAYFRRRVPEIIRAQAQSFDIEAKIEPLTGYPVLVNDAQMTDFARDLAIKTVGEDRVRELKRAYTGGEDFSFMLQHVPGSYLLLGSGRDGAKDLHNPGYDFNDDVLMTGAAYWVDLVGEYLKPA